MTKTVKHARPVTTRTARQLAEALALDPEEGIEIEVRSSLVEKIVEAVAERRLTHAEVARLSSSSRTRVTAILNRNTQGVSTDLLLRILGKLGYRARIVVTRAA